MKKSLFLFIPLILMLIAAGGLAEKPKKVLPSKTTTVKKESKETDKQEQPKPNRSAITPAQVSPKQYQPPAAMKPAEAEQSQVQPAPVARDKGRQIKWQVISQGGTDGASSSYQGGSGGGSSSYRLDGTVTQTAVGSGSSASYQLLQGFWQKFGEAYACGDANEDGVVDLGDAVYLLNYLFKQPWPPPVPYMCIGDVNNDDLVDLGDVVYVLNYLFKQPWPSPDPGCCSPVWAIE